MRLSASGTRLFAIALVWLLTGAGGAWAQSGTSGVRGTVADEQGAHVPGATVTLSNPDTAFSRTTTTDASGDYQFVSVPPGNYTITVELTGFRTAIYERVSLPVDVIATQDVQLTVGQLTESVQVVAETRVINTTDASLGNVISGNQVRALPLEARSVVGLLSLQAGAVFVPTNTFGDQDNRSGAVSGARADQANVTLDGVDNNDPLFNTAYAGALRSTLDSLQEFRVTTSNYGADSGRSSAAQVSLVTKSGSNVFHGSAYDVIRRTSTSANEYFNKLAGNDVPKLDKNIYGGAFGGALIKDKLFFFGNYERLKEDSEALTERQVPSLSMRDGVMVYQCADPAQCPGGTVQGFSDSHADRSGVLRRDALAARRPRPARHRPQRAGVGVFQGTSRAERRRARRLQHHGVQVHGAVQQHLQHDHRARGLPARGQPQLLRAVQRAARYVARRPPVSGQEPAAEHVAGDQELGHGYRLGLRAELEGRQHVPVRLHEDGARHDRDADTGPWCTSGSPTT